MSKVRISFPTLFHLLNYKLHFRKTVVESKCLKHYLICLCTESEIELAKRFYQARVDNVEKEPDGWRKRNLNQLN